MEDKPKLFNNQINNKYIWQINYFVLQLSYNHIRHNTG